MRRASKINEITSIFMNSNEHVENYKKVYNFDNAKILSVVGSGDQYFTSILNGAKKVDLFDINKAAWDYFRLRFYAIQVLSYEEYLIFFVLKKFDGCLFDGYKINVFEKILRYIPIDLQNFLYNFVKTKNGDSSEIYNNIKRSYSGETLVDKNGVNVVMPHFSKEEYYKLQSLLKITDLPEFSWSNLIEIPGKIESSYDLMFFSNIYDYLRTDVVEYKNFLKQFNAQTIQAHYLWYSDEEMREFLDMGFDVDAVMLHPNTNYFNEFVISLKRTK